MNKFYLSLCIAVTFASPLRGGDFDNGFFIMNEEGSGVSGNGSINYFEPGASADDAPGWTYRADRLANQGKEIAGAICHAIIADGKMYLITNHPIEAGSYSMTGALTVLDAATLKFISSHELLNSRGEQVQGRAACAGQDGKILITTTNGILQYDPATDTLGFSKLGVMGTDDDPQPYQYPLQTGSMVNMGGILYIAAQKAGLVILDEAAGEATARTLSVLFNNQLPEGLTAANGIGSIVKDNDGNLWMSVTADCDATGDPAPFLVKYTPATGKATAIAVPEGIYPPANSWYAWTPDGFHYSTKNNALYWNGGASTWFSNQHIYKYDIPSREFSMTLSLDADEPGANAEAAGECIYGCSMRSCPETGDMYVSLFKDYGSTDYELMRLDADGNLKARYPMQPDYWFPSYILFPKGEDAGLGFVATDRPTDGCTITLAGKSLNLNNPTGGALPLQIYTPAGTLVECRSILPGESNISLGNLPGGIYIVRMSSAAISLRL